MDNRYMFFVILIIIIGVGYQYNKKKNKNQNTILNIESLSKPNGFSLRLQSYFEFILKFNISKFYSKT